MPGIYTVIMYTNRKEKNIKVFQYNLNEMKGYYKIRRKLLIPNLNFQNPKQPQITIKTNYQEIKLLKYQKL